MNVRTLLLGPALVLFLGCQSPVSPPATPGSTPASGVAGLRADLDARGADTKIGDPFMSEPIGGQGMPVCVGAETLRVYEFIDHEAALAASARINRDDPSKVGNGIVDWAGAPRFWLRDRLIVLYLGDNAATDAALRGLLGKPFAESHDAGRGLLPKPPCQ